LEASICRRRLQSVADVGGAEPQSAGADLQASIGGQDDGQITGRLGLQSQTGGRTADGRSRGRGAAESADGRSRLAESADGRTADEAGAAGCRRAPPDSRSPPCSLSLPPLLSFLLSLSPFPRCSDAAARAREYRRAISRLFPARARGRRVFSRARVRLPLVWRPPDALATPWRARRRHTHQSRGEGDAPIQKTPGRLGVA